MKQTTLKKLGNYLFRGVFILAPIFITLYAIYYLFILIDTPIQSLLYNVFGVHLYGVGILTTLFALVVIGYLGSTILMDSVFKPIEAFFTKIPVVKEMYKALKDIIGAFVSDKKKFEKPVMAEVRDGIFRIGFITNEDMEEFGIEKNIIAVYFPLSYAFTGELLLIEASKLIPLDSDQVGNLMKFVISGGLVNKDDDEVEEVVDPLTN